MNPHFETLVVVLSPALWPRFMGSSSLTCILCPTSSYGYSSFQHLFEFLPYLGYDFPVLTSLESLVSYIRFLPFKLYRALPGFGWTQIIKEGQHILSEWSTELLRGLTDGTDKRKCRNPEAVKWTSEKCTVLLGLSTWDRYRE